jgi:hypothetical protein
MDLHVSLCVFVLFSKTLEHKNNVMTDNFNLSNTAS